MKQLWCLLIVASCYSQTDSIINTKVKSSWYTRSMMISLMSANQPGEKLSDRIAQNIEIGKSFGMMDVGVAIGRAKFTTQNLDVQDKIYIQGKLTMDACQYGIFSNEISIGAGYMFSTLTPVVLEISSTVFAQIGDNWGIGVVYGNYNFTGDSDDLNKSVTGLFIRYGLIRDDGGILLNRTHTSRPKRSNHRKNVN